MPLIRDLCQPMQNFLTDFLLSCVRISFGIVSYVRDFIHMAGGRHTAIVKECTGGLRQPESYKHAVVIALYPNENTLPFTLNLMKGFAASGFFVLGVSTKPLPPALAAPMLAHCHHIIERFNMGYDFGSYQMGIRWLARQPALQNINMLAIANDSLFYSAAIADTIKDLLKQEGEWIGLFESFEGGYHVQSFFEIFRGQLLQSRAFRHFWNCYRPFSSRVYAIEQGERGLSDALLKAGFKPVIACSGKNIKDRLVTLLSSDKPNPLLEKYLGSVRVNKHYPFAALSLDGTTNILPARIETIAQTTNPTQSLGLLCHFLLGMPIKCDLCYRGTASMEEIVELAQGFSPQEINAIKALLESKGPPPPRQSWRRVKTASGVM